MVEKEPEAEVWLPKVAEVDEKQRGTEEIKV